MSAAIVPIVAAIAHTEPRVGHVTVVAVDGGAASGKSSLAGAVANALPDVAVIHTDDLLDGWDGQFAFWPRLRTQVLDPLAAGLPARYQRYDWIAGRFTDWIEVPVPKVLVVEGVSAIHACAEYLTIGVLLDVPRSERERRWRSRNGELQPEWVRWLDREDAYFGANPVPAGVLVLRSAGGPAEQADR
jgi:uridine kinase